ncbi:PspC domain-containing protein [Marinilabilia salmonicolor]|uniref:PspC domain-containing protein n=1 Tax=Marinilabilia salmonicolor TaxID=989 RepID=UPI00029B0844|nr:PspC domain-containing protein [Marinilabilia salmonicolor]
MKKVMTINIAGRSFYIDEDAYARLEQYLKRLEHWSEDKEEGREILSDIEGRIRELLEEKINPSTGVITLEIVSEIIATMGEPEEFTEDGNTEKETGSSTDYTTTAKGPRRRRLYRDMEDKVFGGVCSGIAAYFNIDRVVVRVLFALLAFLSFGTALPVYIILWIAIPPALTSSQRLEMRGDDVTISNIEKNIKNEYNDVKERFQKSSAFKKGEDYLSRFQKRDRNVFIIAAVIVGVILLSNLISIPFHMGFGPALHMNMPLAGLGFPGIFPLILILLILGLAFRSAMKGFLILIGVIIAAAILFRVLGFVVWPHVMHSFL